MVRERQNVRRGNGGGTGIQTSTSARSLSHGPTRRGARPWHDPCEDLPPRPVMIQDFAIHVPPSFDPLDHARLWDAVTMTFPTLPGGVRSGAAPHCATELLRVRIESGRWRCPSFDPVTLDRQVHRAVDAGWLRMTLVADEPAPGGRLTLPSIIETVTEVATRYQRFIERRNIESAEPQFEHVLAAHRSLFDLSRPLVRADYEHAIDAWRWLLRLDPGASQAVQLAALFHDVERLISESEVRIEQHATDYLTFKRAHAARGAALTRTALRPLQLEPDVVERAAELVFRHEVPGSDPELQLLNDADALSYFSLNSCGFLDHYGPAHTVKKIDYTLRRLSPWAFQQLRGIRLREDFAKLLRDRLVHTSPDRPATAVEALPSDEGSPAPEAAHRAH